MSGTGFERDALKTLARLGVDRSPHAIDHLLAAARTCVGMDVAVLAEFVPGREVFRKVEGEGASLGLVAGAGFAASQAFLSLVADGRLPTLLTDVAAGSHLDSFEVAKECGVGSYVGVPVTMPDGHLYGALACLHRRPSPAVGQREVDALRVIARMIGDELGRACAETECARLEKELIGTVLRHGALSMAFQPILDLRDGRVVGVEALARFGTEPERSPAAWFASAEALGVRVELELAALRAALSAADRVPESEYLSVNASAGTVCSPGFVEAIEDAPADRLVVEISDGAPAEGYEALAAPLEEVRRRGVRVAVDDACASLDTLAHVHRLRPDFIKLDISLIRNIDRDPIRQSLASSLVSFAGEIDASVTAEGIETAAERDAVQDLGVEFGQGWLLAEPRPLADLLAAVPPAA